MQWFIPSAYYIMYLLGIIVLSTSIVAVLILRKYISTRSKIAFYLLIHVLLFLAAFMLTLVTLVTEYGHDYLGWDVPYLRRYSLIFATGCEAAGTIFLVRFADAVFNIPHKVKNVLFIYGVILLFVTLHPANHYEIIPLEPVDINLAPISTLLLGIYVAVVSVIIYRGAASAAEHASEKIYEIRLKFISYGALSSIVTIFFSIMDTIIFNLYGWGYNFAAWGVWISIAVTIYLYYFGYAMPKFILKRYEKSPG
ncbi:MAG: hypothetical protein QXL15_04335 [Candidatus Korarchaeota archaeon]